MSDVEARLVTCFTAVFPRLSPAEITRADMDSVGSWDSMATLTLTGLIEEEFHVSIDPRDREELRSFALILEHLRAKVGGPHGGGSAARSPDR